MTSNPCAMAMRIRLLWYPHPTIISNKENIKPSGWTGDLNNTLRGWVGPSQSPSDGGYSFKKFWGNCYELLGDMAKLEGMQQLCHQYYLQNGELNAIDAVGAIRKFLRLQNDQQHNQ